MPDDLPGFDPADPSTWHLAHGTVVDALRASAGDLGIPLGTDLAVAAERIARAAAGRPDRRVRALLLAAMTLVYGVPTSVHRRVERDVRRAQDAERCAFSRPTVDPLDLLGLVDAVLELRPELRGHVGRRDG